MVHGTLICYSTIIFPSFMTGLTFIVRHIQLMLKKVKP